MLTPGNTVFKILFLQINIMKRKTLNASGSANSGQEKQGRRDPSHDGIAKVAQRKVKVVVIDDENHIVKAVCRALKSSGLLIVPEGIPAIKSLSDAKSLIDREKPDIVVSDKQFDLNNRKAHAELLQYLRENHPDAKVALHSSALGQEDKEAGFDELIAKPCFPEDLIRIVEQLAGKE